MEYTELPPIKKLVKACKEAYFVGGVVRDLMLNIPSHDIDVVVDTDPLKLNLPKSFPLDKERGIYRLNWKGFTIDVSKIQGESIIEDLKRRDFTVNSVAYDLKKGKFIDPLNGTEDLKKGLLRAVSEENLKDDPIRLLRCVRLWLYLPLRIEKDTEKLLSKHSSLVSLSAPERIKEEMIKILAHPLSKKAISKLDNTGILENIIPELKECRGLFQGKFFGCDLKEHLLFCYRCCETLVNFTDFFLPEKELQQPLKENSEANVTKAHLLKLSALLHDIAKPKTFKIRNQQYTFWGHDKLGAKVAQNILERLTFSTKSARTVGTLVENHMRLHLLARSGEITPKAKGRFFRQLKGDGVLTVLLSLADSYASSGDLGFFYLLPFAKEMLDFYMDFLKQENLQKPLLSGHEIMDILKISPGPVVGQLKEKLLEAQTEGLVKSKEEALEYIKEVFKDG